MNLNLAALGRFRSARAAESEAQLDLEKRVESAKGEVVRFSQESIADLKLIDAAQRQVNSAAESYRLSQAGLSSGAALALDVLVAQDALNDARQRLAGAIVKYNEAQVNLLAALGLLDSVSPGMGRSTGPAPASAK